MNPQDIAETLKEITQPEVKKRGRKPKVSQPQEAPPMPKEKKAAPKKPKQEGPKKIPENLQKWSAFVDKIRSEHPRMDYKKVLKLASKEYK